MRDKYISPEMEIIRFTLNTKVLAASDTGENEVEDGSNIPELPGGNPFS